MKLLGFNLSKINAQKGRGDFKDLKIESKLDVKDIKEASQTSLKFKEELLAVTFSYEIIYKEDLGSIGLEGTLVLAVDPKTKKEVINQWTEKKMAEDFKIVLFNIIMRKSSLKALELEESLGLPYHIQFPVLKKKE